MTADSGNTHEIRVTIQLQPGLRGGDPLPPRAHRQSGDDHRHERGEVQRPAEHVRRVRGDERDNGFQHRVGDPAAHQDDAGGDHGPEPSSSPG
jgi:hypothetical protein